MAKVNPNKLQNFLQVNEDLIGVVEKKIQLLKKMREAVLLEACSSMTNAEKRDLHYVLRLCLPNKSFKDKLSYIAVTNQPPRIFRLQTVSEFHNIGDFLRKYVFKGVTFEENLWEDYTWKRNIQKYNSNVLKEN